MGMKAYVTTSWDDGHHLDSKLAEVLYKYDMPATFYIPIEYAGKQCLTHPEIKQIAERFDVGGHTYHHVDLTRVSLAKARTEIEEGKRHLEDIVGRESLSFAYPYGFFNSRITEIVKQAGFCGARSVNLLTRCWADPLRMSTTVNAVDLSPLRYGRDSVSSLDISFFSFILKNNLLFKNWYEIAVNTLNFIIANGGIWHLWGHSQEIEEHNAWGTLEEILKIVNSLSGKIRKVTNTQLVQIFNSNLEDED